MDVGPDLPRRLPEAERTVAGGQLGVEGEAVLVTQADQELVPALLTLAEAVVDRQELLLAAGVGADQDQHALPVVLETRREVDPIRPDVDVPLGPQVTPLPWPPTSRVRPGPGAPRARPRIGP